MHFLSDFSAPVTLHTIHFVVRFGNMDSWTPLQEDLWKLEAFHMGSQRMILGILWHDFVRNTEVVDRTNLPCVQDIQLRPPAILNGVKLSRDETHCLAMW